MFVVLFFFSLGARTNIKNKADKIAQELAAKDPETAALLAPYTSSKSHFHAGVML